MTIALGMRKGKRRAGEHFLHGKRERSAGGAPLKPALDVLHSRRDEWRRARPEVWLPPKVSVVIPAKNEEMNLDRVLDDLQRTFALLPACPYEVIVVDDKSSDRTGEVSRVRGARVIRNDGASGKGRALRLGFQNSTGEIILMMDADYSHRAEDIPKFLEALKDDAGLVIGSRVYGGSDEYTPIRALGNVFLTYAVGLFLGRYLSDALNGFKAFRRDVYDDFNYTANQFEIEIELIANTLRKGYRVVEISSHERERAGGEAKSRVIRHGTRFFWRVFTEWLRNRSALPSNAKPRSPQTVDASRASESHPPA